MIRNIFILIQNDLAVAYKNKTFFLLVLVPMIISISFKLVDDAGGTLPRSTIGLIRGEPYPPAMISRIEAAKGLFVTDWLTNEHQGKNRLKDKTLDGVLIRSKKVPDNVDLLVYRMESIRTIAIIENLSVLQRVAEQNGSHWISGVTSLGTGGAQQESLPTWVLMMLLLVGFIVIPTQVAEEKEKKLLLGLLQTPMSEKEWILAKLFLGMILVFFSILFLHIFGGMPCSHWLSYLIFLGIGSLFFSSLGILLGFLCRTQASARALGVAFYLPNLLPAALADFSQKMNAFAHYIPAYQFYEPVKSILLEGTEVSQLQFSLCALGLGGLAACTASYLLFKKRWLM